MQKNLNEVLIEGDVFAEARVDAGAGVIHNVALLGKASQNGRRYSSQAMDDAVELYDGARYYLDHPTDRELRQRGGSRSVLDLAGRIRNPRRAGDKVRGDVELLDREPTKSLVLSIARQMPEAAGNSHRASGDVRRGSDGADVVERITAVEAVELVTNPATTAGLFESVQKRTARDRSPTPEDVEEALGILYGDSNEGREMLSEAMDRIQADGEPVAGDALEHAYDILFG